MCNEKFEFANGSYSVSDVSDHFDYIIQKHETVTDNPPIRTYVSKIEYKIAFRIKTEYYLEPFKNSEF